MSRGQPLQQRQLTLTEELEKIEQSITLTLQEIDHNFSRAHRIVTGSILPIVEQYAAHSKDVWEGSRFWKQFFESSANVSLSGYEEQPSQQETEEETLTEDSHATTQTTVESSQSYDTPSQQHISTSSIADIDVSNVTATPLQSTPKARSRQNHDQDTATFAEYSSPYEALRKEVNSTAVDTTYLSQANPPQTPGRTTAQQVSDIAMTPKSSPFLPTQPASISRPSTTRKRTDPLLHRVLDRTYRIQATPLTGNRYVSDLPSRPAATPSTNTRTRNRGQKKYDSILSSSPEVAPPELHPEIFSSPERRVRTPGVSVLTPARNKNTTTRTAVPQRTPGVWDSDDEEFEDDAPFDQSPPKTMQFHIPQSRLMKTPAKEASARIVTNILTTAGLSPSHPQHFSEDEEQDYGLLDSDPDNDLPRPQPSYQISQTPEPDHFRRNLVGRYDVHDDEDETERPGGMSGRFDDGSPSVVRKMPGIEDESF